MNIATRSAAARPALGPQLVRRKSIADMEREASSGHGGGALRRNLSLLQLTMISIGATLGTGILVVLSGAIPLAGPGIWIAFLIAGLVALLSAISYAEMAGMVPVSGSSYSYAYATMGEGLAWICGWCLILEYAVSVAAVAVGASDYVDETFAILGFTLPEALARPLGEGGIVNVPALAVVLFATVLLVRGARESALVNSVMVLIKAAILIFFCVVAFTAFNASHFEAALPMGAAGITAAASRVFFSFIGFDAASTAGEEARNPKRDMPRAILLSLAIVTTIYVLVAIAAIGAREWQWFAADGNLVGVLQEITGQAWIPLVFAIGAVLAISSVVLTVLYGQTRILLTMSRDGLIPGIFSRISKSTGTPAAGTWITGGVVALAAAFIPLGALADATSIGTLFAFGLVNVAVIYLRRTQPERPRTFRAPLFPLLPVLGALSCLGLMTQLDSVTWLVFALWMLLGALIYVLYGRTHSRVGAMSDVAYRASHLD